MTLLQVAELFESAWLSFTHRYAEDCGCQEREPFGILQPS